MNHAHKKHNLIYIDFRDNGIVISISIAQLIFEFINVVFYGVYMNFFYGMNGELMDKFFALYNITTLMVIQPSFYLKGDENFRKNWVNHGPIQAIKMML